MPPCSRSAGRSLADELRLQRDRGGGDDDTPARRDRGRKVGEALARTGRRLGNEMVASFERVGDRIGEGELALAFFPAQRGDGRGEERAVVGRHGSGEEHADVHACRERFALLARQPWGLVRHLLIAAHRLQRRSPTVAPHSPRDVRGRL